MSLKKWIAAKIILQSYQQLNNFKKSLSNQTIWRKSNQLSQTELTNPNTNLFPVKCVKEKDDSSVQLVSKLTFVRQQKTAYFQSSNRFFKSFFFMKYYLSTQMSLYFKLALEILPTCDKRMNEQKHWKVWKAEK